MKEAHPRHLSASPRSRRAQGFASLYAIQFLLFIVAGHGLAQTPPATPDHPWHAPAEQATEQSAIREQKPEVKIDPSVTYSLTDLIGFAEAHNPDTRVAWQQAEAQAAALGVARADLYPTVTAAAIANALRFQIYFIDRFYRQTIGTLEVTLDLNYTIFDYGARAGRIDAAKAQLLAANFGFNDVHRQLIFRVSETYYQLLNAIGQVDAARASLANAQTVQQDAEARLSNGLATLPDVLLARSATAQDEYALQAALGAEDVAHGDLATALSVSPTAAIQVTPIDQLALPDSLEDTVDQAIDRAFRQRPDLMSRIEEIRAAHARLKEAHAAYGPTLTMQATPQAQDLYGVQQALAWNSTADLDGTATFQLSWTLFDGGARKNRVAQAQADVRTAQAQADATRDQIENQIWTAYSNLKTAFRQRQAAEALLVAANQSYDAAIDSYRYGVRSLLDVTAAQQTLAQARSADVLARAQVLTALADLAFQTGDSIQPAARRPQP